MYYTTDSVQRDKDRMYYLKTTTPEGNAYMQTTYPLLGEVMRNCPEVEGATHAQSWNRPWLKYGDKEIQENTMYVDTGFFRVFSFPLKYGNTSTAFQEKQSVVMTQKASQQLFGTENPLGRIVQADGKTPLTVTGILEDIPTNSTLRSEIFLTTALLQDNEDFKNIADWYNTFSQNFLKLKPGSDVKQLESQISQIVALNYAAESKKNKIIAVPFSQLKNEAGPIVNLIIKGSIGTALFILLIVVVNLLNLNTASIYTRSKEVAVRQMIGSGKTKIVLQFCVENALIVFASVFLGGCLFYYLLLPQLNDMYGSRFGEMSFQLRKDYPFALLFLFLGILVSIAAGSLPSLKLISLRVSDAVKGNISGAGKNYRVRNAFITVQFTLAIIFICITLILNRQIHHMKTAAMGFDRDDVVVANLDLAFRDHESASARFESILNELRANPAVSSFSTNSVIPTGYWENFNDYYDPATNKEVHMRHVSADAGFVTTFEIPVVLGRNFDDALASTEVNNIMINQTAMKALGWSSIEGKVLKQKGNPNTFPVVGVMKDFHYQDMQKPVEPLVHWYAGKQGLADNNYLSLNIPGNHKKDVLSKLGAEFKVLPSRREFSYEFMSDRVNKQYAMIDGILKTTNFVALLTIIVSCMGMFGLISLLAKQRVKEIGIRKVLGASVAAIVGMLSKSFIRLVVIACIIAFPIAWWAMHQWLENFPYRITIHWWMFALAGLVAICIAALTVGSQAIKAAIVNPVKSLRSE